MKKMALILNAARDSKGHRNDNEKDAAWVEFLKRLLRELAAVR